jgi:hypothetical protein
MGNRSYLSINKPGERWEVLFEGNNSLAHFWMLLLQKEDVESVRSVYREIYQPENEDAEIDTDIRVGQAQAIENARGRRDYIARVYPDLLDYYDEWLAYLERQPSDDDTFFIDLIQLAGFYETPDEFLNRLAAFYDHVAQLRPAFERNIPETSGWDGTSGQLFAASSSFYRNFPEARMQPGNIGLVKTPGRFKAMNYAWGAVSLAMVGGLLYLFRLFPHFWQHILIALLFAPVIYISIKGFLLVERWSGRALQKQEVR